MKHLVSILLLLLASCTKEEPPKFALEPLGPKPVSIRFDERSYEIYRNEQKPYRVLAVMDDGSENDVTAMSRIDAERKEVLLTTKRSMSGIALGKSRIEAEYAGLKARALVVVEIPPIIRFRLQPDPVQLRVVGAGDNVIYRAVVLRRDSTEEDVTAMSTWTSSDSRVVRAGRGTLVALNPGQASVTVEYEGYGEQINLVVAP